MNLNNKMKVLVNGYDRNNSLVTYTNKEVKAESIHGIISFIDSFSNYNEIEKIILTDVDGKEFSCSGVNAVANFWSSFCE